MHWLWHGIRQLGDWLQAHSKTQKWLVFGSEQHSTTFLFIWYCSCIFFPTSWLTNMSVSHVVLIDSAPPFGPVFASYHLTASTCQSSLKPCQIVETWMSLFSVEAEQVCWGDAGHCFPGCWALFGRDVNYCGPTGRCGLTVRWCRQLWQGCTVALQVECKHHSPCNEKVPALFLMASITVMLCSNLWAWQRRFLHNAVYASYSELFWIPQ